MDIIKAKNELLLGKTIYDMNLRVADYGRVSTDKDDQLNSLENQKKYFGDMISSVDKWTHIDSYIDEGISGTSVKNRDDFLRMIEDARHNKIDLILTKEVSRFARNTIDSIKYTQILLKYGVIVYFISDNINTIYPDSEFRLTLMASMAQDEVRKLSERVKFGIKRSIKDRKVGGGGLYGYTKRNGKLTIIEEESKAVKLLYELYATESYGFKKIGEILASKGYYTRKGKIFSDSTLKKMLINPRYKGFYTANMSEIEDYKTHKKRKKPKSEWIIEKDINGNIPPIIDEILWNRCNEIYIKRQNIYNKNNLNKEFFLENKKYTSKLFCKEHNKPFIRNANGKRKNNPVWQCKEYLLHGLKKCQSPIIYEKYLDEAFSSIIDSIIDDKNILIDMILNDYIILLKDKNTNQNNLLIKSKIDELFLYKKRLLNISLNNMISDEEFINKNSNLDKEIINLKRELNKSIDKISCELTINNIKNYLKNSLNIKENIGKYFDLFIKQVLVTKINNNRKNIKLHIIFNFNNLDKDIELLM